MSARRQIIAALSEDSMGGIATLQDVDHAEQLVDAHRAEVLNEAAAVADSSVALFEDSDEGAAAAGAMEGLAILFRRMAREKSSRPAADATPDFFQPGRTYTEPDGSTDWKFRCDAITTHPEDGERTALGWRHFRSEWSECAYGEDDWDIHQLAGITEESA